MSFIAFRCSARNSLPSMRRSVRSVRTSMHRGAGPPREKTAAPIHQKMAREIATFLARIFAEQRKAAPTDLEAIETALRDRLHQLGTKLLTGLPQADIPPIEQRQLPCPCGRCAHYLELGSKTILAVVAEVQWQRPYYRCAHCGEG
jgi:hypothetical protein